ncbi:MAG: hypothetical protein IIB87_01350 [Chloroflexi bacterium]|nr:hypothetical protein [Chloroflexota bacterium]
MRSDDSDGRQVIVSGAELLERLADEIVRSDRYGHPFTILTLRPPEDVRKLSAPSLDVVANGLTRGCDVVCTVEGESMVLVLLPETDVPGAAALLERLRAAFGDTESGWDYEILAYPQNKAQLKRLIKDAA